jgi:hypothetical protein
VKLIAGTGRVGGVRRTEGRESRKLGPFSKKIGVALRRSPYMMESEEQVLSNARILYPPLLEEEVTIERYGGAAFVLLEGIW